MGSGSSDVKPSGDQNATGGSGSDISSGSRDAAIYGASDDGSSDKADKKAHKEKKAKKARKAKKSDASSGTGGSGSDSQTFKRDVGDRTPSTVPENDSDKGSGSPLPEEPGTY